MFLGVSMAVDEAADTSINFKLFVVYDIFFDGTDLWI